MIYYALRSTPQYLELLERARQWPEPHHLFSVVGGLAFLHALGSNARRLTLVDADAEVLDYARLMLALITRSSSLMEFIDLLTGHRVRDLAARPVRFGVATERTSLLARILPEPEFRALFERTYGKLRFNPRSGTGKIGEAALYFCEDVLARDTFCWRLGKGNLADEEIFRALQAKLRSLPIEIWQARLEEIDYGALTGDLPLVALISNCDSPMFTLRDAIFRRMKQTLRGPIHYLSWVRSLELGPSTAPPNVPGPDMDSPFPELYELGGRAGARLFPHIRLRHRYTSLIPLERVRPHGAELFVCSLPPDKLEPQLSALLDVVVPAFKRLVFTPGSPDESDRLLSLLAREGVGESYHLQARQIAGREVVVCELQGLLPLPAPEPSGWATGPLLFMRSLLAEYRAFRWNRGGA